jgi:hypothetical protein
MVSLPVPPSTVTPDVDAERRGIDAVEAHARAVGGDGEDLGAVAAVDLGRIGAVTALGQIGVVARIPDHAVVAGLAEHLVVAVAAGERVVAGAAEQKIVATFAEQGVVAGFAEQLVRAGAPGHDIVTVAAEQVGVGQRTIGFVERDRVVALEAKHLHRRGIGDRRRTALDGNGAAVDQNVTGRVAAGRDRVVEIVSGRRQHAGTRDKSGGNSHRHGPLELPAVRAALGCGGSCAAAFIGSAAIGRSAAALVGDA